MNKYSFYVTPTAQTVAAQRGTPVALSRVSKRAAKAGRRTARAARDGVRVAVAPDRAYAAAGLRHSVWQWQP